MAAGLKVCSASQCTGLPVIGSVKTDLGSGWMIGAVTGRTKGPNTQLCVDWASSKLAGKRRMETKTETRRFPAAVPAYLVNGNFEGVDLIRPHMKYVLASHWKVLL